jgi:hypothetical protein
LFFEIQVKPRAIYFRYILPADVQAQIPQKLIIVFPIHADVKIPDLS